jgi:GNAT superfamily N-acetyltransferase
VYLARIEASIRACTGAMSIKKVWAALVAFLSPNWRLVDDLSRYQKTIVVVNDTWNGVVDGQVTHQYHDAASENVKIGYITFRLETGQIGIFFIEQEYRDSGLGKQMLLAAITDIKARGKANTVWAVTSLHHPFWSNVWNKSFQLKDPAHFSVTAQGYSMPLWLPLDRRNVC